MNITKDVLSEIDYLDFGLENCDVYSVKAEDIIDIQFDEIQFNEKYKYFKAQSGRIVVSKNAFRQPSNYALKGNAASADDDCLYDRLKMCCDITSVGLYYKNGKKFNFLVEYDPLANDLTGNLEMEYSNCPSMEIDENGDMLLLFGTLSRSLKRVDNDYFNYIEGLEEKLPRDFSGILSVEVIEMGNGGYNCWNPENGLYVELRVKNKGYKVKYLPLQFFDVSDFTFDFCFGYNFETELTISPSESGRLFVQFGESCNFFCKSIKVFEGF